MHRGAKRWHLAAGLQRKLGAAANKASQVGAWDCVASLARTSLLELEGNLLHLIPLADPKGFVCLVSETGLHHNEDRDS